MWTWVFLGFFGLGCSEPERTTPGGVAKAEVPTRVIVLGMDTVRRDDMGAHGQSLEATPNLDRIAEQSLVFDNAWAPAPRTRPMPPTHA